MFYHSILKCAITSLCTLNNLSVWNVSNGRVIIVFAITQFGRCVVRTSFTFCKFSSRTIHVYTWMHFTILKYLWQISIPCFLFDAHIGRRTSIKFYLLMHMIQNFFSFFRWWNWWFEIHFLKYSLRKYRYQCK